MLLCELFGHRRSASAARMIPELGEWESVCKRCGAPMIRIEHGKWRLKTEADRLPEPAD